MANAFIGEYGLDFDIVAEVAGEHFIYQVLVEPEHCFLMDSNDGEVIAKLGEFVADISENGFDEPTETFTLNNGEVVDVAQLMKGELNIYFVSSR